MCRPGAGSPVGACVSVSQLSCPLSAGRSGSPGGTPGQGAVSEGPGGWSEEHHDGERGEDPGPRRETGRPDGQVRGSAGWSESTQRAQVFRVNSFVRLESSLSSCLNPEDTFAALTSNKLRSELHYAGLMFWRRLCPPDNRRSPGPARSDSGWSRVSAQRPPGAAVTRVEVCRPARSG